MSGVGKALIQGYSLTYALTSGQEAFVNGREEVERKIPLMQEASFGIAAFLIPIAMSALYQVIKFRSTLDVLGVIFSLNAGAFLVHAGMKNWGRKPPEELREDQEEQPMLRAGD